MSRSYWFPLLTCFITLVVVHGSLWLRGVRPSKRTRWRELITWEVMPKDERTKVYLQQRLLTAIVALPLTAAALHYLF